MISLILNQITTQPFIPSFIIFSQIHHSIMDDIPHLKLKNMDDLNFVLLIKKPLITRGFLTLVNVTLIYLVYHWYPLNSQYRSLPSDRQYVQLGYTLN